MRHAPGVEEQSVADVQHGPGLPPEGLSLGQPGRETQVMARRKGVADRARHVEQIPRSRSRTQDRLIPGNSSGERQCGHHPFCGERADVAAADGGAVPGRLAGDSGHEFGQLPVAGARRERHHRPQGLSPHGGDVAQIPLHEFRPGLFGRRFRRVVDSFDQLVDRDQKIVLFVPFQHGAVVPGADDDLIGSGEKGQDGAQQGQFADAAHNFSSIRFSRMRACAAARRRIMVRPPRRLSFFTWISPLTQALT